MGFVKLIDEFNAKIDDNGGVQVRLENSSYSAVTNEDGRFEFKNLSAGTYNLIYEKDGFGSYKLFSYQFVGGNAEGLVWPQQLYQLPTIEVKDIEVSLENDFIRIFVTMAQPCIYAFQVYLSYDHNVSEQNYVYMKDLWNFNKPETEFEVYIAPSDTLLKAGDKIYLKMFYRNYRDFGYYDREKEVDVLHYIQATEAAEYLIE